MTKYRKSWTQALQEVLEGTEIDESTGLQMKMAFDDAKIKVKGVKGGKLVIDRNWQKEVLQVLTKSLKKGTNVQKAIQKFIKFEEVELDEAKFGDKPLSQHQYEKLKMWNKLKTGGTIKLWFDSGMSKGTAWREFKIGRKTKSKKYDLEKISLTPIDRPGGVKYYLYNRKDMISLAIGDMAATLIAMKEEVELDEAKGTAYPPTIENLRMIVKDKQHQKFMFDKGQAIVDTFTASAMVQVYDALKPATKKKFEDMIKSKEGFMKSQAFAMKMAK